MPAMLPVRVVIVDDDHLMRAGLRMILETAGDLEVVAEASDGDDALRVVAETAPDVVLMDIRMPGTDGIEATRRLTAQGEGAPRVLVLTTFELDEYVFEALRAGASGFLLKRTSPEDLVAGIRVVAAGDALLSPSVTRRLVEEFARRPVVDTPAVGTLAELTDREREVLAFMARGLSNAELAERLFVGEATVKTHVKHILMKLGVESRVQAVVVAYEAGLVRRRIVRPGLVCRPHPPLRRQRPRQRRRRTAPPTRSEWVSSRPGSLVGSFRRTSLSCRWRRDDGEAGLAEVVVEGERSADLGLAHEAEAGVVDEGDPSAPTRLQRVESRFVDHRVHPMHLEGVQKVVSQRGQHGEAEPSLDQGDGLDHDVVGGDEHLAVIEGGERRRCFDVVLITDVHQRQQC
jgi:DNA-binding NarL/FixJ family response regulator